jgi:hypothetical protein
VFLKHNGGASASRKNVREDWIAALPRDKWLIFDAVMRRWESSYAMLSVALDNALSLHARGELDCAGQHVSIAAELLGRLASTLISACDTLADQGRHVSDLPIVEPLKTEFFRGSIAQTAASWNGILHCVLFGDRARYLHKLQILSEIVEQLDREFRRTADEITAGTSVSSDASWRMLDCLHYDFNTCLREAEVVLKSFLRALPPERVFAFAGEPDAPTAPRRLRVRAPQIRASAKVIPAPGDPP